MTLVEWVKGWHVASVAIVLALIGYGVWRVTDDTTSTDAIERGIRSQLTDQVGEEVTILAVECPDTVEWSPGEEFHCFAKSPDGTAAQVTVFMENGAGEYTWRLG